MTKYNLEEFIQWAKVNDKELACWDWLLRALKRRKSHWFNYRCNYLGPEGSDFTYFFTYDFIDAQPYFQIVDEYKKETQLKSLWELWLILKEKIIKTNQLNRLELLSKINKKLIQWTKLISKTNL